MRLKEKSIFFVATPGGDMPSYPFRNSSETTEAINQCKKGWPSLEWVVFELQVLKTYTPGQSKPKSDMTIKGLSTDKDLVLDKFIKRHGDSNLYTSIKKFFEEA